jgi:hypothetical protein
MHRAFLPDSGGLHARPASTQINYAYMQYFVRNYAGSRYEYVDKLSLPHYFICGLPDRQAGFAGSDH